MIRHTLLARLASEVRANDAQSLTAKEARVRGESKACVQEPERLPALERCIDEAAGSRQFSVQGSAKWRSIGAVTAKDAE